MAYAQGTTTFSSGTGLRTIPTVDNVTGVAFKPTWYKVTVEGPAGGTARNYVQRSVGVWRQAGAVLCTSETGSGSNWQYLTRNNGRVIEHYSLSGSTYTPTTTANHDSVSTAGVKFNVTNNSSSYDILFEAGDQ